MPRLLGERIMPKDISWKDIKNYKDLTEEFFSKDIGEFTLFAVAGDLL